MRINFIIPFTNLTGGIKVIFEYCNRLKEVGHEINIYVPMKAYKFNNSGISGFFKTLKSSIGNTFIRGKKVKWFNLNCKIKLVPYIADKYIEDADICVATAWPTAYDVEKLCDSKGKKVYFIQGYEVWSGNKEEVENSYKLSLNQIVITKSLKDIMNNKFKKNAIIIYNGIDKNDIYFDNKFSCKDVIISIMYHELEIKGFKDGVSAIELVREKYPKISVKAFGTKRGEGIPDYIEFYENPTREELKQIYIDSDIYVFPSRSESWGLTVIESMACKCAVVGTNTGVISEIGINNKNCLISEPMDIKSLADNIITLIEDDKLKRIISNNGYNLALSLEWNKSVKKMEEFFENLI